MPVTKRFFHARAALAVALLGILLLPSVLAKQQHRANLYSPKMQALTEKYERAGLFTNDSEARAICAELIRRGIIRPISSNNNDLVFSDNKLESYLPVHGSLTVQQIADRTLPSIVRLTVRGGNNKVFALGTGFVIGENIIATNAHVIKNAWSVNADFLDGKSVSVLGLIASDSEHDIALLFADTGDTKFLPLSSDTHSVIGESVVAVGNPEGLDGSISTGIVSGIRSDNTGKFIQTNAAISPGSSGGPLLNNIGSVIGITSFTLVDGQNLNFAHPAYYIKKLLLSSPPGYLTWDRIPANDKTLGLLIVLDAEKFSFDHPNISNTFNDADFVRIVFMRHGISLPKLAKDQAAIGYDVPHDVAAGDASQWSRGDRLYFALHHPFIDHTGIYIGQGQFMHITENPANHGITVDKLTDSYYATHLVAVRRSQELLAEPVAP